jgi:hypothetical protein
MNIFHMRLGLVAGLLLAYSMGSERVLANGCSQNSIDASVRSSTRDSSYLQQYHISFKVTDTCPDDDDSELIYIHYTYKTRWNDGSIHEHSSVISGYIKPKDSHRTVINTEVMLSYPDKEIVDIYVDKVVVP